ncbi:helicase-related protein [Methylomicrobium album]|uniref:DNA/RNA helicase, superfamily II n=1 Tax=Methylomicrobium album BG8 TaxID=686340 RepID=H8GRL1_METAL|nr:helicase-related protein [Methylomicrobium album]EIC27853.1 DNA/RNA helicase, superfamily II [Methylomicrobium album BG8]
MNNTLLQPGKLVSLRGRDWIVLPSDDKDLLVVKPLGGSDDEMTGIYLPLAITSDQPVDANFSRPSPIDLGDIATAKLLYDSARLAFRNGAGPFRCLAKLSFRPRSYQMVPLIMALRQDQVRLLVADDVGVGKTVEALLVAKELLERRKIKRFAVVCLPHLCEQWQAEIRDKLDIEAVIIRSNTQARLDRQIQGDTSVYDYYPYQVISIDFIKSDARRDVFIEQCPELVIVDEAHTCARPTGASNSQQQRYHLLNRIARKPNQQLILLTATPHSGKPEEFQSLLGLIAPEFETLDLPNSSQHQRRELARHFVQRKRADVEKWLDEDTPFPEREAFEWSYDLSPSYAAFFDQILDFARKLVAPQAKEQRQRVQYWTALALLRGVMSSPAAGIEMLNTRLSGLTLAEENDATGEIIQESTENPVGDTEFGFEGDNAPTQVVERNQWSAQQRQQLRYFAEKLQDLSNIKTDQKLAATGLIIEDWLNQGFNPVIFCRYIATANYVGEQLAPHLKKKYAKLDLQVITSELPDELRKQRIEEMGRSGQRVLIATDCLSEGINLQDSFTGILHYDLPWNPNRLEQREGRVDRYGQLAPTVKACLLYGSDNPIDGIVLDVLLRKVREIKRATGINVPFPEDSQSIIDTITQALLLNPDRKIVTHKHSPSGYQAQQTLFDFCEFNEAETAKAAITRKVDEAAEREKTSRSIFAQNAIKAQEIEADLREIDEAIGDPRAVEAFVTSTMNQLLGVQLTVTKQGYRIVTANLPPALRDLLPHGDVINISFQSPTPENHHYLGRNHRFVEQLCQLIMANTLARVDNKAARAAVIRTRQAAIKTTLMLFRCRNVIEQIKAGYQIVAEEMLLWGWRGTPQQKEFLDHETAKKLLNEARATSDLSSQARASFLDNELKLLALLDDEFQRVAEQQSKHLVESHQRFSALMDKQQFQVVYPVLPMDLLGIYILLPE